MKDIFAILTGIIHVYIFVLESILWKRPRTQKVFGMTPERAEANKLMAYNQGFYNLFLALAIFMGIYLDRASETPGVGRILIDYGMLSIFGAGLVLISSAKNLWRAALIQAIPPAIYFLLRILG